MVASLGPPGREAHIYSAEVRSLSKRSMNKCEGLDFAHVVPGLLLGVSDPCLRGSIGRRSCCRCRCCSRAAHVVETVLESPEWLVVHLEQRTDRHREDSGLATRSVLGLTKNDRCGMSQTVDQLMATQPVALKRHVDRLAESVLRRDREIGISG
jgi:hypothetical protein